uniref:SERTA domain-containing protein n=1 Tax=Labrus bergylta TaxID=56723 RepID=A0A3Q3LQQ5_9LABR
MIMKGQKRKHPPEDVEVSDRSSPCWETQRQFVFSVSMNKYQRGQELPEPSLRRSVLIANTLRRCITHSLSSASNVPLPLKDDDEDWGSMSTDSDFSLSAAISSILTALDCTIDGSAQAAPRTPLRSLENLSGLSEGGVAGVKGVRDFGGNWEQQEECRAASSYLSDLTVENLFQDIDTSLLERDMCVLGLCGSGGGYVSGDELLRYLPPLSSVHMCALNFPPEPQTPGPGQQTLITSRPRITEASDPDLYRL